MTVDKEIKIRPKKVDHPQKHRFMMHKKKKKYCEIARIIHNCIFMTAFIK